MSNLRALLTGDIAALRRGPLVALHWALRVACALCFIGHGALGVITKVGWLPFYETFGIPEWVAWPLMPIIGTLDITLGIAVLFHPCRAALLWMAAWSAFTALMCPLVGFGWWEIIERAGEYGPPIVFLLLSSSQKLGWFEKIEARTVAPALLQSVRWALQITTALLLVGHGALGAFATKQILVDHWSAVGFVADTAFVRWLGSVEILLGLTALFVVARPFVVGVMYWKLATESLYVMAGNLTDIWEIVQRGGDFVVPLALLCVLHLLEKPESASVATAGDAAPRLGLAHALRVAFASLAFTASLSTAYAWMRVDIRAREHYFADYAKLMEDGYQHSGWIPPELPASSRFIHEVHELTSKVALASFHVSDPAQFLGYIARLQESAGTTACEPPAALLMPTPHWSSGLVRLRAHQQITAGTGNRAYAYEPDTGQVFTWTCAETGLAK